MLFPTFALGILFAVTTAGQPTMNSRPISYPNARTVDHIDTYHGVKVHDPYRWLENLDSRETRTWIEAENRLTRT